jgi:hypothetical protein
VIRRAPRPEGNFTVLHNHVLRDARLSFKARGLLAYILSMPDNFRFTAELLTRNAPDGRAAVMSGLRELRDAGYLTVRREQTSDGRWRTTSTIHDCAQTLENAGDEHGEN